MKNYILKRILLIPLTMLGILIINFVIIQFAPGGPIEHTLAKFQGINVNATAKLGGAGKEIGYTSKYQGAQGVPEDLVKELEKQFGFDKPAHVRFAKMILDYARFDFGKSFYQDKTVGRLIWERMPVSISLGLWSTLIIYLVAIPLGIKKAVTDGSKFDVWTSFAVIIGSAIPVFLFAVFLIVFFAGGTYLQWFPLHGLTSDNWENLSWLGKIKDYFWHITLPVTAMVIGGFASLTMLTKNSFMDEINKQYVMTARAKGLSETRILYGHVFRNAMLIVIAGFPSLLIKMLFTGSLLIEVIFSLNGLGLLGYEAIMTRDYPVIFGTMYIFALLGLVLKLLSDIAYSLIDPRINFESQS
ncbi:MAG: microcin C ABC transporter permease YejB [Alphaproteobacteria bacterium]|nr:microcin C ABC transporter permease YejB [Alphaproteobacteria bacterium]MBQ7285608.1 microcin C ABC transporter permease YejB [Alphaproteobacteria bacterium]